MSADTPIDFMLDESALASLSVAPTEAEEEAETDTPPDDTDPDGSKLDDALEDSMDASDPPAVTQPGLNEPAESSGYDEEAERQRDS